MDHNIFNPYHHSNSLDGGDSSSGRSESRSIGNQNHNLQHIQPRLGSIPSPNQAAGINYDQHHLGGMFDQTPTGTGGMHGQIGSLPSPLSFSYPPPSSYSYFDAAYTNFQTQQSQPSSSTMSGISLPKEEEADSSEGDTEEHGEEDAATKRVGSGSGSGDDKDGKPTSTSPKKKPRITLARGGACVACRNRKLKCTGERPCKICKKTGIECRYEEIPRKKPRNVLLEERVVELETLLLSKGEAVPPSALGPPVLLSATSGSSGSIPLVTPRYSPSKDHSILPSSAGTKASTSASSTAPTPPLAPPRSASQPNPPSLSLHSHRDLAHGGMMLGPNAHGADILPNSSLEFALINVVLPHTPYLAMPIHPQRFLALLTLPVGDPSRPHPALLYILFAEAVRIIENKTPPPKVSARHPLFGGQYPTGLAGPVDSSWVLPQVQGSSVYLMERARTELDAGIRNVDRPFDLARAATGIARYLYSLGRFIEGWAVPVSRLVIACGLHRITGTIVPPEPVVSTEVLPRPYASTQSYLHQYTISTPAQPLPTLRMRPIIVPPPRDEIDLAERVSTFWAAKAQDWAAGVGWGWTTSIADEECTTEWPWGAGGAEIKNPAHTGHRFSIRDLFDVSSPMHGSTFPDTPYTLAMKSMCLLHRANHLFDRPESSYPVYHPDGRLAPSHIPPLSQIRSVEAAITLFRKRIPPVYAFPTSPAQTPSEDGRAAYDGPSDPWWSALHVNLYTAEMLMCREMAHYDAQAYERAVSCARAVVGFVRGLRPDSWIHAALDLSLVARFLYKESDRLRSLGQQQTAAMAADEGEILRVTLARDYAQWMPMASLHALIVQRVREGWAEKEGEYERV